MKRLIISLTILSTLLTAAAALAPVRALAAPAVGSACTPAKGSFFGLPTWYEYLDGTVRPDGSCQITISDASGNVDLNKIWLVGLALIDILMRLAGVVGVGYVIYGGFKYMISQGDPASTKAAKTSIINAFIGISIVLIGVVLIQFLAKVLS